DGLPAPGAANGGPLGFAGSEAPGSAGDGTPDFAHQGFQGFESATDDDTSATGFDPATVFGRDGTDWADRGREADIPWPPGNRTAPGDYVSPKDLSDLASPGHGGPRGGPALPYGAGYGDRRTRVSAADSRAVVLAAADPANAYGSALPWPEPPTGAGHKPGRKAGSLVVLVDGELTLYMERGGKSLLAWPAAADTEPADDPRLRAAADALAAAARAGALGTVTVERVNGGAALTSPVGTLLEGAGFVATPRGLRLRA
ncbi:DEAD/DEAH box helicase, partial [Streptomyces sp. NPDC004752]